MTSTNSSARPTRLAILSRAPAGESAKTRLAAAIGPAASERFFVAMIGDLFANLAQTALDQAVYLTSNLPVADAEAAFRGASGWQGPLRQQPPGTLTQRLDRAFLEGIEEGFARTLVIGTDAPQVGKQLLAEAERALEANDVVLGPAVDGGYYLIGANRTGYRRELVIDIPWGTADVLAATQARARSASLSVALLRPLIDLDRVEDLRRFVSSPESKMCPQVRAAARNLSVGATTSEPGYHRT